MERDYNKNRRSFRPERSGDRYEREAGSGESYTKPAYGEKRERREYSGNRSDTRRTDRNEGERNERNYNRDSSDRERTVRYSGNRERKPFSTDQRRQESGERPVRKVIIKKENRQEGEKRPRTFRQAGSSFGENQSRDFKGTRTFSRERKNISGAAKEELRQRHYSKKKILAHRLKNEDENTELRLNRYISMGGVCSRRDADELIVAGRVKVNGEVVQTVGMKVRKRDMVEVDDVQIFPEKKVYLVLNKPKDYVTTVEDPLERKTVMSLVEKACKERIYPVGRLDRQTTGVLLFTNDGDLAKKLTHPKYDHKKIYHVFLDKALKQEDFDAIEKGVELEDGFIKADEMNYTSPDCTEVGIEIHSGKNRIVRRIFEHFGYEIVKLDRVYFAGITKKNLPRGTWRFLTQREVSMLKAY